MGDDGTMEMQSRGSVAESGFGFRRGSSIYISETNPLHPSLAQEQLDAHKASVIERAEKVKAYENRRSKPALFFGDNFLPLPSENTAPSQEYSDGVLDYLYGIPIVHWFFYGNGEYFIIPLIHVLFVSSLYYYNVYTASIASKAADNALVRSNLEINVPFYILLSFMLVINYGAGYWVLRSKQLEKVIVASSADATQQRSFLVKYHLAICIGFVVVVLLNSVIPVALHPTEVAQWYGTGAATVANNFLMAFYTFSLVLFFAQIHLAIMWVFIIYVTKITFEERILDKMESEHIHTAPDTIFVFFTRLEEVSALWYWVHVARTLFTIIVSSIFFILISIQRQYISLMEEAGAPEELIRSVKNTIIQSYIQLIIFFGSSWSAFLAAGYLNDKMNDDIVSKLGVLLMHTDVDAAKAHRYESLFEKQKSAEEAMKSDYDDSNNGNLGDDVDDIPSQSSYADARTIIRDLITIMNSTFLGFNVGGYEVTLEKAISIGTILFAGLSVLIQNENDTVN